MGSIPSGYLRHTVTIYAKAGSGPYGPTYSAAVDTKAHVVLGKPIVVKTMSEEVTADVVVYVRPETVCPEGSKVVYENATYRVLRYTKHSAPGLPMPDHIKLVLVPYAEDG